MKKEYGSDFHFIDFVDEEAEDSINKIYSDSVLFFSGRAALYNLIEQGIKLHNWQNIFLPDYNCHDVDEFIKPLAVNIFYYDDGPYKTNEIDVSEFDKSTNVFIHLNYFGFSNHSRLSLKKAYIIEDHTHDLTSDWALNSKAHYCFASLRKSLPVPCGGIAWSPKKLPLTTSPHQTELGNTSTYMKLSGMLLKKIYLENGNVEKQDFRNLYLNSEAMFSEHKSYGNLAVIVESFINKIPIQTLRKIKIDNYNCLLKEVINKDIIWEKELAQTQCPFGFILYFNNEQHRNTMKNYLIDNRIYPAVLWPDQANTQAKDFSSRNLLIHCDVRYNSDDMKHIAAVLNNYKYAV